MNGGLWYPPLNAAVAGFSPGRFEMRWDSVLYPRHSLSILSHLKTLFQRMMAAVVCWFTRTGDADHTRGWEDYWLCVLL